MPLLSGANTAARSNALTALGVGLTLAATKLA